MKNRLIIVIILLIGVATTGAAIFFGTTIGRPNVTVTGRVLDAVEAPVAGATVTLDHKQFKNVSVKAKTDSKGFFSAPVSYDGKYAVIASKSGETSSVTIDVSGGRQKQKILLSLPIFAKDYAKIPPVNPATDVIVDEEGMEIVKNVAEVVWNEGVSEAEQDAVIATIPGAKLRGRISEFDLTEIETTEGGLNDALATLKKEPKVKAVMKDYVAQTDIEITDPDYADGSKNFWLKKVEAEEAWGVKRANPRMIVAVIDAGFQNHADLNGTYLRGLAKNYTSEGIAASPRHGNHVSGIIAMQPNDLGLLGAAFGVKIMPIKVNTFAQMADAIRLAADTQRVRVISMSMGMGWRKQNKWRVDNGHPPFDEAWMKEKSEEVDQFMIPAVRYARNHNRIMVHSAGNDRQSANYNSLKTRIVVTVSNLAADDTRSPSSNYGPLITIGAPGTRIWSTVRKGHWDYLTGTSMSTPLVAGIIALVRSADLGLSVEETISIIKKTAVPVEQLEIGNRINAWQALLEATDQWGVKGKVLSQATRQPVAGAWVYPKGMPELKVKSDKDGNFTIPAIPRRHGGEILGQSGPKAQRKKGRLELERLPRDQWVHRDVELLLKGKGDPVLTERGVNIEVAPLFECIADAPPAGWKPVSENNGTRAEIWFNAPVTQSGQSFEVSRDAMIFGAGENTFEDVRASGTISSVYEGGKVTLVLEATLKEQPLKGIPAQPFKMELTGVVNNQGDTDSLGMPLNSPVTATELNFEPLKDRITMYLANATRVVPNRDIPATCEFVRLDEGRSGMKLNEDGGSMSFYSRWVAGDGGPGAPGAIDGLRNQP